MQGARSTSSATQAANTLEKVSPQRNSLNNTSASRGASLLSLPREVLEHIVDFLLPTLHPDTDVFPPPRPQSVYEPNRPGPAHVADVYALLRACKRLQALCVRKLYFAPFLPDPGCVNQVMHAACQNVVGKLIPDTSDLAQAMRALHLTTSEIRQEDLRYTQWFCACDVHVLLSLAPNIRHLSLHCLADHHPCETCEETDYDEDGTNHVIFGHPIIHFLSESTKCRPEALRISLEGPRKFLSLNNASTFAPLSRLTHLELSNIVPSKDLLCFLIGGEPLPWSWDVPDIDEWRPWLWFDDEPISDWVRRDVSAGYSPHLRLECLRLSRLPNNFLCVFDDLVSHRQRLSELQLPPWERIGDDFNLPSKADDILVMQNALYELASNSHKMPKLRLLILDLEPTCSILPKPALSHPVEHGLLGDLRTQTPPNDTKDWTFGVDYGYATEAVSSSFVPDADVPGEIEQKLNRMSSGWQRQVTASDRHWLLTQMGKDSLSRVWNATRARCASNTTFDSQTEIRVTSSRSFRVKVDKYSHRIQFQMDRGGERGSIRL